MCCSVWKQRAMTVLCHAFIDDSYVCQRHLNTNEHYPSPNHKSYVKYRFLLRSFGWVETTDISIRFLDVSLSASLASYLQAEAAFSLL